MNTTKTSKALRPTVLRGTRSALIALCCAAGLVSPATAHHSFSGFDAAITQEHTGIVKEVKWTNPHVWLTVLVEVDGVEKEFNYEGGAIAVLKRGGWFRETVNPGDKITVVGHPFRDDRLGGSMDYVVLEDGKPLAAGDAIPGALRRE